MCENVLSLANQDLFNSICEQFSHEPNLYTFFYDEVKQRNNCFYNQTKKRNNNENKNEESKSEELFQIRLSILQKNILTGNNETTKYLKEVKAIDVKLILNDASLVLADHIFQTVLEGLPNTDSASVFLLARMVILPKVRVKCLSFII